MLSIDSRADLTDAQFFLDLLGGPNARWTFQTFDDSKRRREERAEAAKAARAAGKSKAEIEKASKDPFARIFHGTLDEHRRDLRSLNEVRAGIFVTVNETDLKGRKARTRRCARYLRRA